MGKRKAISVVYDALLVLGILAVLFYRYSHLKSFPIGFWWGFVQVCVFVVLIYLRVLMKD